MVGSGNGDARYAFFKNPRQAVGVSTGWSTDAGGFAQLGQLEKECIDLALDKVYLVAKEVRATHILFSCKSQSERSKLGCSTFRPAEDALNYISNGLANLQQRTPHFSEVDDVLATEKALELRRNRAMQRYRTICAGIPDMDTDPQFLEEGADGFQYRCYSKGEPFLIMSDLSHEEQWLTTYFDASVFWHVVKTSLHVGSDLLIGQTEDGQRVVRRRARTKGSDTCNLHSALIGVRLADGEDFPILQSANHVGDTLVELACDAPAIQRLELPFRQDQPCKLRLAPSGCMSDLFHQQWEYKGAFLLGQTREAEKKGKRKRVCFQYDDHKCDLVLMPIRPLPSPPPCLDEPLLAALHSLPAPIPPPTMDTGFALVNASCFDVLLHLPKDSIGLIIIDPPYGHQSQQLSFGFDDKPWKEPEWQRLLPEVWRILKATGRLLVFGVRAFAANVYNMVMTNSGISLCFDQYNWVHGGKQNKFNTDTGYADYEIISAFWRAGKEQRAAMRFDAEERPSTTFHHRIASDNPTRLAEYGFECMKPPNLYRDLVSTYERSGDGVVLDFTMNAGSCGYGALREGRRFIGVEAIPADVAVRWRTDATKSEVGSELKCAALLQALQRQPKPKQDFTVKEFRHLGVKGLELNSFIKAGGKIYRPVMPFPRACTTMALAISHLSSIDHPSSRTLSLNAQGAAVHGAPSSLSAPPPVLLYKDHGYSDRKNSCTVPFAECEDKLVVAIMPQFDMRDLDRCEPFSTSWYREFSNEINYDGMRFALLAEKETDFISSLEGLKRAITNHLLPLMRVDPYDSKSSPVPTSLILSSHGKKLSGGCARLVLGEKDSISVSKLLETITGRLPPDLKDFLCHVHIDACYSMARIKQFPGIALSGYTIDACTSTSETLVGKFLVPALEKAMCSCTGSYASAIASELTDRIKPRNFTSPPMAGGERLEDLVEYFKVIPP